MNERITRKHTSLLLQRILGLNQEESKGTRTIYFELTTHDHPITHDRYEAQGYETTNEITITARTAFDSHVFVEKMICNLFIVFGLSGDYWINDYGIWSKENMWNKMECRVRWVLIHTYFHILIYVDPLLGVWTI